MITGMITGMTTMKQSMVRNMMCCCQTKGLLGSMQA